MAVYRYELPLRKVPEKPHEEDFGARFLHESGHEMRIPGFYNGENNWVIRFCPPLAGKWNLDEH